MEIDRLDEGDARAVSRGNGDRLATGSPAETPDLVVTHETRDRATYYAELRAAVDAEQRTTPEPSDLRQAWAAHEAKWPLAERPVAPPQPDTPGAWHGDGGRHLSPDANAEISQGCEKIRENGETVIIPTLRRIEAEEAGRHLPRGDLSVHRRQRSSAHSTTESTGRFDRVSMRPEGHRTSRRSMLRAAPRPK